MKTLNPHRSILESSNLNCLLPLRRKGASVWFEAPQEATVWLINNGSVGNVTPGQNYKTSLCTHK